MLVSQTDPVGVEPFSFVKIFFCSVNFHSCWPRDLKGSVGHLRSLRLGQSCVGLHYKTVLRDDCLPIFLCNVVIWKHTFKGLIRHIRISVIHLVCPPPPALQKKFCITFVLNFPWVFTVVPIEIEDNAYAKFWGTNKVDCGSFANGEWCKFFDSKSCQSASVTAPPNKEF